MSLVNNLRIAKNTMLLYIRMLLIMGVSLFTSRVILQAIGVEDFGIYNLIGGFVTVFSIVSNTLVIAMQRYFNVALGKKNYKQFSDIFIMSMNILFIIIVFIIIISETAGIWFINTHLNIPSERMRAANWVYQFSILTFITNLIRTPYNAAIISEEKMAFYAYVSILEAFLRLVVAYLLMLNNNDRLILYAILYFAANILITYIYKLYCNKKLNSCHFRLMWKKDLFKELLSFTGWSLVGQAGYIARSQGDSFFVNKFYSVAVNAAMGVNSQVTGAITSFVNNFQTAFRPQITKSYAANEMDEHFKLLFRASKFSFYLMIILSVPVIFNIDFILNIWLVEVPIYTSIFIILGLTSQMILAISSPFAASILATGKIKGYQITLLILNIAGVVISYLFLRAGYAPYFVAYINIIVQALILVSRMYFMHSLMKFNVSLYIRNVLLPALLIGGLSLVFPYFTNHYFNTFLGVLFIATMDILTMIIIIYLFGIDKSERVMIRNSIKKITNKLR